MSDTPAGTGSGPSQGSPRAKFRTSLLAAGKTATGIEVPPELIERLGAGKRPAVVVTIGPYTYRSTVGVMGGRALIPVSADHRRQAGIAAGDDIDVTLELDTAPATSSFPPTWPKPSARTIRHAGSSTGCPPARRNGTSSRSKAPRRPKPGSGASASPWTCCASDRPAN